MSKTAQFTATIVIAAPFRYTGATELQARKEAAFASLLARPLRAPHGPRTQIFCQHVHFGNRLRTAPTEKLSLCISK